ncbi:MAG: peptidoglycan DD-metalloendopeptidase family protein [Oscillospiraceae bacterium]|nr:peptidoglycan DD-metalloendopeptidase family protein [Oscillospiraceae bacterium]
MRFTARAAALLFAAASALVMSSNAALSVRTVHAEPVEAEEIEFNIERYGVNRVVDFETVIEYDDTMYSDETEVVSEGVTGLYIDKMSAVYYGGELVKAELDDTVAVTEVEPRLLRVGTLPGSRADSRGYYIWPVEGVITSYFGTRSVSVGSSNHRGIDIGVPKGTAIAAADSGDVIFAGWASGYGNFVKIRHDNGDITCYGHLSKISVSEGDRVIQGDKIGEAGSTGVSTGSHLHFEIREGGVTAVNPLNILPEEY